jgi:hypothetical protein
MGSEKGKGRVRLCWVEEEGRDIMVWRGAAAYGRDAGVSKKKHTE